MQLLERKYQAKLIPKIRRALPGCLILKNDSSYIQGIPDLSIFYGPCWGMLEVKAKEPVPGSDDFEPNQEWYLEHLSGMSFVACIYPENEREVLRAIQQAFGVSRTARVSKSK